MAIGALLGQNPGYTKKEIYSTATQALYPSGTNLPDQALALLSKAIVESQDGTELKNLMGEVIASLPLSSAKIETGSYVGTGTYGVSNPNSITFSEFPKLLIIGKSAGNSETAGTTFGFGDGIAFILCYTLTSSYPNRGGSYVFDDSSSWWETMDKVYAKRDGNSLIWYGTDSSRDQLNLNDKSYTYIAFI